jgi:hypothetical protein
MMGTSGGSFVRSVLRAILSLALLFGSGVGDWAPASAQAGMPSHESCCCGTPASAEDSCPCPKPESNRSPSTSNCQNRTSAAAVIASRRTKVERRTEPRPEPDTWARALDDREFTGVPAPAQSRGPDLGRHLALLSTFRI